ncbi:MAG: DegT/DnrJ/EryC1/StrS family aminotransferase [Phycisphaerae bacterium]
MSAESFIPLARPDLDDETIAEALRNIESILRQGRLSMGPYLEELERSVASSAGRTHGVGVSSGTAGLHLCLRALGIGAGDEVVTTPFSFIATTNCLLFENITPVFADIDPDSYNLDPAALEAAITPRTRAILPVEVFGNPAHFDEYERIARSHNLALIEDCCEALGARLGDRPAGSFGDCGVFAFYPNKQITTGEGGLIVTDNEDLRDLCVSMRNQGRDTGAGWLAHARLGYNYRMPETSAAIGCAQMQRLEKILARRREAAELYDEALADIRGVHLPPMHDRRQASWFVYVIRLADEFTRQDRDKVMEHLRESGVSCSNYFAPIHLQPFVRTELGTREGQFPQTERIGDRTIALPFFAGLDERQVSRVREALEKALPAVAGGA